MKLSPFLLAVAGPLAAQTTSRVSVDSAGMQGDASSRYAALSGDGLHVAFHSDATNLVPGDTNGVADIFVRDLVNGVTTLVSVDSAGVQANAESEYPSISADGRYVAFYSDATNLVPGDTNGAGDVFVRDVVNGVTTLVSVDSSGAQGDLESSTPGISADGLHVAFASGATNLVPGDTNGAWDIFVHDSLLGTTVRVNVDSAGAQSQGDPYNYSPSVSSDGRRVAFQSFATDLVPGDTNVRGDIFVRDTVGGTTIRVSVDSAGVQANNVSFSPSISADGLHVAFYTYATNLVPGDTNGVIDVFAHDIVSGITTLESVGAVGPEASSFGPSLSADGRFVAFHSSARLVPEDENDDFDIYARDRQTGRISLVSAASSGAPGDAASASASISADGRRVAFSSRATNLVPGDTNGSTDVFLRSHGKVGHSDSPSEIAGPPASTAIRNGSGANEECYFSLDNPVLGRTWSTQILALGPGRPTFLLAYDQPHPGLATPFGELLVLPPALGGVHLFTHGALSDGLTATHEIPVPFDLSLAGMTAATQAFVVGDPGGTHLCNAIDVVLSPFD